MNLTALEELMARASAPFPHSRFESLDPNRVRAGDGGRKAMEAVIGNSLTWREVRNENGEYILVRDPYPSPD